MSFTAYQCSVCGLRDFIKAFCCGKYMGSYEAGAPGVRDGAPNVVPDHLAKYHDWSLGEDINSRSERNRKYKEAGLRQKSFRDMKSEHPGEFDRMRRTGTISSYPGQKRHGTFKDIRAREGS
tara:strand:+ start:459 stop:824 length:366 start_codon:yes stop_codon:yes gene_type:complete